MTIVLTVVVAVFVVASVWRGRGKGMGLEGGQLKT